MRRPPPSPRLASHRTKTFRVWAARPPSSASPPPPAEASLATATATPASPASATATGTTTVTVITTTTATATTTTKTKKPRTGASGGSPEQTARRRPGVLSRTCSRAAATTPPPQIAAPSAPTFAASASRSLCSSGTSSLPSSSSSSSRTTAARQADRPFPIRDAHLHPRPWLLAVVTTRTTSSGRRTMSNGSSEASEARLFRIWPIAFEGAVSSRSTFVGSPITRSGVLVPALEPMGSSTISRAAAVWEAQLPEQRNRCRCRNRRDLSIFEGMIGGNFRAGRCLLKPSIS
mmetsp:Transcript_33944/g.72360  ORF Transcript_33944/g.72360 Transcript_33944/m.72360 type:complete len:291 (+) Transcript_33944:958-1830(+)